MEFNEVLKIFGTNVYKKRTKIGMTRKELSIKTGIRKEYLKKIEEGSAKGILCSHIFRIAQALKIEPYEICEGI